MSRRGVTVGVLAAIASIAGVGAPGLAAAAPRAPCLTAGDRVVAANDEVVVTTRRTSRFGYRLLGCLARTGKRRALATVDGQRTNIGPVALSGRRVAFTTSVDDPGDVSLGRITTVDVSSGRRRSTGDLQNADVRSLVLGQTGRVAWIQHSLTSETSRTSRLFRFDGARTELVLDSPALEPGSLAVDAAGTTIYWTVRGQPPASAAL